MRIDIDEVAVGDLEQIAAWIAKDSPRAAISMLEAILTAIDRLSTFPAMGRRGRADGTYERVVSSTPYIIVYELRARPAALIVVAVFHGARER